MPKYYRCSGAIHVYKDDVLIVANNKEEAQREFECYIEHHIDIEDFEAVEEENPTEIAINE